MVIVTLNYIMLSTDYVKLYHTYLQSFIVNPRIMRNARKNTRQQTSIGAFALSDS